MNYKQLFSLKGKVAVITGGAGLIGKELVKGLAESGAVVVLCDIDSNKGKKIASELAALSLNVIFQPLDITRENSIHKLIKLLDKEFKHIDIWINNAYPKTKDWGVKFEQIKFDSGKKNLEMHLGGYFLCCQKVAQYMRKQKSGVIINLGSIYGLVGPDFGIYQGTQMTVPAVYSAIKGGIINFSRYLAAYYGKDNIRVNVISPGGIYDRQPSSFVKRYTEKTLLKRMGSPSDVVSAAIFLASDAAKYITGHNLVVDGGWTAV